MIVSICNMKKYSTFIVFIALTLLLQAAVCQENDAGGARIMFYNVENLFYIYDDSITADEEFLPQGAMRWSYTRYNRKISSLFKTITAAGEWSPPEIVAFCEVENRLVLNDLISRTYLNRFDYEIVHEDSPDPRGIDVCLIYRKDRIKLLTYRYLKPDLPNNTKFTTRSVLYASFLLNTDTLHVFVNHWPSRRGGTLAGEGMRIKIAEMEKSFCDSILLRNPQSKILIGGDFNSMPGGKEIGVLLNDLTGNGLINLSEGLAAKGRGTYRYRGSWEMIDQILVSKPLLDNKSAIFTNELNLSIFDADFLLMDDPLYPGVSPNPTYRGRRYNGGFSDHLPVLVDIHFNE